MDKTKRTQYILLMQPLTHQFMTTENLKRKINNDEKRLESF